MTMPITDIFQEKAPSEATAAKANPIIDYAEILNAFGLQYAEAGHYWQVGENKLTQGWILHLSIVREQFEHLMNTVIPVLIKYAVPFKIIRDRYLLTQNLEGHLGSINIGKSAAIYPVTNSQALALAKHLISLTSTFIGPAILTDRRLGDIIYTRYGAFNPIYKLGQDNTKIKYIYNKKGDLMPDPCSIPFSMPIDICWPFDEITTSLQPSRPKLLNKTYFPIVTLKSDAKGDVKKAIYFKKPWKISTCVIKQGRSNMLHDRYGRTIKDRLVWQYKIGQQLSTDIPLPKIIDYFEADGDAYLVMELIRGVSLGSIIETTYNKRAWHSLSAITKSKLLGLFSEVLQIVECIHKKGFVHRDLSPENFLLDNDSRIWLIDNELMCHFKSPLPDPPFALGTPGFISQEQERGETPTPKEDIFALGAFMVMLFTGLHPLKFDQYPSERLKSNLLFFTQEPDIVDVVTTCLHNDPVERPTIATIQKTIQSYKDKLQQQVLSGQQTRRSVIYDQSKSKLEEVIQASINSLADPAFTSEDHLWFSSLQSKEDIVGNEQLSLKVYDGWHTGAAGPLWLTALAKAKGFDVSNSRQQYDSNWKFIKKHYFKNRSKNYSLFSGGAGIALALSAGYRSGLMNIGDYDLSLKDCFSNFERPLTLADGIAGQGIALLQSIPYLEAEYAKDMLTSYVSALISTQRKDGSWDVGAESLGYNRALSLAQGVPGVAWFLLNYLKISPDIKINESVAKALNWLTKKQKGTINIWPLFKKSIYTSRWSLEHGALGTLLVMIKAFEVLGDDIYREIVEANLKSIPEKLVLRDLSMNNGLAGLGQIYLEALRVFKNEDWRVRSEWITQVLLHTIKMGENGQAFWLPRESTIVTADLSTGNAGIVHFLMRYSIPDKVGHPLSPLI
jgi:serine/threonine protein kinase